MFIFTGCGKDNNKKNDDGGGGTPVLSSNNKIGIFSFRHADNSGLLQNSVLGSIDNNLNTVILIVPPGSDLTKLVPYINIDKKAKISPQSGVATNFSKEVTYTVTAENGDTRKYSVKVSATSTPTITSISIDDIPCIIDGNDIYCSLKIDGAASLSRKIDYNGGSIDYISIDGSQIGDSGSMFKFAAIDPEKSVSVVVANVLNKKTEYNLIFTTIPIISIRVGGNGTIPDEPKINCNIMFIDPLSRTNGNIMVYSHNAGIETRGAYSQRFDKKSYSLEVRNENNEEEEDISFLGLRKDGDWIFDAMYIEPGRMRNRICTNIWNTMNKLHYADKEPKAINGTRGTFVELFLNNEYRGLYCMTERIDRKQLKLDKDLNNGGVMYKGKDFTETTLFNTVEGPINNSKLTWCGFEAEFPADEAGNSRWEYIENLARFVSKSTDTEFKENVREYLYMQNTVDYFIFVNVVMAHDNFGKNIYWSIYNTSTDNRFFCTPWDMDGSLGRRSNGDYMRDEGILGIGKNSIAHRETKLYHRLYKLNADNFKQKVKDRWNQLKTNELSVTTISKHINDCKNILVSSGAIEREMQRWPEYTVSATEEAQYMCSWYSSHFNYIDNFFNSL